MRDPDMNISEILQRLRSTAKQMEEGIRLFTQGENSKDVAALRAAADMLDKSATEALLR